MTGSNSNSDRSNEGLSSAEYRARLLTKLNCLVAVLEVAIAKITRSMDLPGANEERLLKIRSNLENTLKICRRAKSSLEKGQSSTATASAERPEGMSYRDYVELSSIDEYRRFKKLKPITDDEIGKVDWDELLGRLGS